MVGTILFGIIALIAVVAALGMLTSKNAVHAAMFLVLNFVCLALFYLGLNAPFLAMVQVTVYAGAIMVLFLFVIMLLGAEEVSIESEELRWQPRVALVLVILLIGVSLFVLLSPSAGVATAVPEALGSAGIGEGVEVFGSAKSVGLRLFESYLLPFQMVGLLLLVGMIGAVVLAKEDKTPVIESDSGGEQ